MNKEDFKVRTDIIKNTFKDTRPIKCHIPTAELELDENIHQEGDFFLTDEDEFVDLEFQLIDFREDELAKYVELAEEIYEKYGKKVSIYIICPNEINVYVKEFEILSDADFTICISHINQDLCKIILNGIKDKMKTEKISKEDLYILSRLHKICKKEEKHYYMLEYLKIANQMRF